MWPSGLQAGAGLHSRAHSTIVRGIVSGYDDMRFGAADKLDAGARAAIEAKHGSTLDWPSSDISGGDAVAFIASQLG